MNNRVGIHELAMALVNKKKLSLKDAEAFVTMMFDTLNEGLNNDKLVKLKGLGTFKVMSVSARKSVDVNTGEPIIIDGRDKISFTPDSTMKDLVNKPFAQFDTVVINDGVDIKELERMDWLENPSNFDTSTLGDISDDEDLPITIELPPSKIEAAVNEAANVMATNETEVEDIPQTSAPKAAEKSHLLTSEQLAALNGYPVSSTRVAQESAVNNGELTLTTDQLRLLNDDNSLQTKDEAEVSVERNESVATEQTLSTPVVNDDADALNSPESEKQEGAEVVAEVITNKAEIEEVNTVSNHVDTVHAPKTDAYSSNEPHNEEPTPDKESQEVVVLSNEVHNDNEELDGTDSPEEDEITDNEQETLANVETITEVVQEEVSDVKPNDSTESNIEDEEEENTNSNFEDEWEEEERRARRKRLIAAGVLAVLALFGIATWYFYNQIQLKDNRISHLETLLNTSKTAANSDNGQSLSKADSVREDSINRAIDAQTKADLDATVARIEQSNAEKQQKTEEKKANNKPATDNKTTERAVEKVVPRLERKSETKSADLDYKQYEKDARVRTGAYKIVGIDRVVTVNKGQTLYSLSRSTLGPGMECYIEAVNGNVKELKAGEKIKIPKLELKKHK
ncbi:MAG: HU family DNA-binding protein [Hoylesella shahii]|uniref:HU family DNA-binding protein n=1 Tax=Hoylesella shahii TaxID=228603 RepID=UPI003F9EE12E